MRTHPKTAPSPKIPLRFSPRCRMKKCTKCGDELRVEEFARDKTKASGRKSICKACDREKSRRYYEANRERKLAYMAERNEALREAREATGWRGRRRSGRPWSLTSAGPVWRSSRPRSWEHGGPLVATLVWRLQSSLPGVPAVAWPVSSC
jgi:hypothetical protein